MPILHIKIQTPEIIINKIMVQTVQAKEIDLRYLIENFELRLIEDQNFFPEWQVDLPEITDLEKQLLDKVRAGFINLLNYPPLLGLS